MIDLFTRSEDRTLLVSVLAALEVRSAIRRRHLSGDIDASDANLAISTLIQETGRIVEHPVSGSVIAEATGLVDRHGLRALDSLQLATAIVARAMLHRNDSMTFAASESQTPFSGGKRRVFSLESGANCTLIFSIFVAGCIASVRLIELGKL